MARDITRDRVLETADALPVFPRVIDEILICLEDPDASLEKLVRHVERDPVLAGRVFAQANAAATRSRREPKVRDLFTATSLIGLSRLREIVIMTSLAGFLRDVLPPGLMPGFWEHSSATGVSARELAHWTHRPTDPALIAGLLHDVGQLWLCRFDPQAYARAWDKTVARELPILKAEREQFGIDHAQVGGWLAEHWGLPEAVVAAIRHHHVPDDALAEPLVAVVHVAEVLSNALDLGAGDARVPYLSEKACDMLGLTWDEDVEAMFGRIDAVSHFVGHYFHVSEGALAGGTGSVGLGS